MVECLPSVNQVQSFVSRTNCLLFAYQRWIRDQPKIILRDVIFDSYISSSIKINRVSCRISSVRSSAMRKKNLYHDWVPIFDRNRLMVTGSISVKLHSKVRPTLNSCTVSLRGRRVNEFYTASWVIRFDHFDSILWAETWNALENCLAAPLER